MGWGVCSLFVVMESKTAAVGLDVAVVIKRVTKSATATSR